MSTKARIVEISDFSIFNFYFLPNGFPYFPFSLIIVAGSRAFATASGCFFNFTDSIVYEHNTERGGGSNTLFCPTDLQPDSDSCTKRYAFRMIV